jgi:EAL domain-containing protein (putative c-di-GMP-specific phosphodiesterase class I)
MTPNVDATISALRAAAASPDAPAPAVAPAVVPRPRAPSWPSGPIGPAPFVPPVKASELLGAIAHHELVLHHQPIVDLRTGRIVEVEALVRWQHPERGLLGPGTFVPQAEVSGEVVDLGRWVFDTGCRQLRRWREQGLADDLVLAVNVSPRQLDEPSLVDDVLDALERHGLPPDALMLEITEGLPVRQGSGALARIGDLRAYGLGIAVDDFGTGHSWIGSVRRFGIEVLKIDRSFVAQIGAAGGTELMSAMIDLGRAVGARVVAEGIETQDQLDVLTSLDCDLGQGFFLARPMVAQDVAARLARELRRPARRLDHGHRRGLRAV